MSCARPLAYGLGLSQSFVMLGVVLLYPEVRIQAVVYTPCVANGTLSRDCAPPRAARVDLGLLCMALSAAATAFVTSNLSQMDGGHLQDESAYCRQVVDSLGLWDPLFWATVSAAHAAALLLACTPADALRVALAGHLMVGCLYGLCRPRDAGADDLDGAGRGGDSTRANLNLLGYFVGLALAAQGVPEGHASRYGVLVGLALLDYFLGVGHVWDRAPTMETVGNSRVYYTCGAALGVALVYAAWHQCEGLMLPAARAGE